MYRPLIFFHAYINSPYVLFNCLFMERQISLVHSQNSHNSQVWASPKPRATWAAGTHMLGSVSIAFPGILTENWIKVRGSWIWSMNSWDNSCYSKVGCQNHKQQLNSLCCNTGPYLFILCLFTSKYTCTSGQFSFFPIMPLAQMFAFTFQLL